MDNSETAGQEEKQTLLEEARHLIRGLERISADSKWARRSSGYRGALLKQVDRLEKEPDLPGEDLVLLKGLIEVGYAMLIKAAREIEVEIPHR
jgi:hypothetical protein